MKYSVFFALGFAILFASCESSSEPKKSEETNPAIASNVPKEHTYIEMENSIIEQGDTLKITGFAIVFYKANELIKTKMTEADIDSSKIFEMRAEEIRKNYETTDLPLYITSANTIIAKLTDGSTHTVYTSKLSQPFGMIMFHGGASPSIKGGLMQRDQYIMAFKEFLRPLSGKK